jgi:hypothetical protein
MQRRRPEIVLQKHVRGFAVRSPICAAHDMKSKIANQKLKIENAAPGWSSRFVEHYRRVLTCAVSRFHHPRSLPTGENQNYTVSTPLFMDQKHELTQFQLLTNFPAVHRCNSMSRRSRTEAELVRNFPVSFPTFGRGTPRPTTPIQNRKPTTFLHHAEAAAYRRVQKLCALAEFPRGGRDATPLPSASSADGRAMCPHSAAPPPFPHNHNLAPNLSASPRPHVEPAVEPQTNPSKIQPFPNQNNGGSTRPAHRSPAPDPCTSPTPCVETDSENPSAIQPLPRQDQGGSTSATAHNANLTPDPNAPSAANVNAQEPTIGDSNSKIAELPGTKTNDQSQLTIHDSPEADFGGESIPINPFESISPMARAPGNSCLQNSQRCSYHHGVIPGSSHVTAALWLVCR